MVYSGLVVDLGKNSDAGLPGARLWSRGHFSGPGRSQGLLYNTFVSQSGILCEKYLNGAITPKRLKIVLELMSTNQVTAVLLTAH